MRIRQSVSEVLLLRATFYCLKKASKVPRVRNCQSQVLMRGSDLRWREPARTLLGSQSRKPQLYHSAGMLSLGNSL